MTRATVRSDGGTPRAIGVPDADVVDEDSSGEVAGAEPTPTLEDVVDAVEAAGGTATVASPADLLRSDLVAIVAPGEGALRALATVAEGTRESGDGSTTASAAPPALPVGCDAGVRSVAPEDLEGALASLLDGPSETVTHARAAVSIDGSPVDRVLRQVAMVTAEPAGISEFAIAADGIGDVDAVRADGVVVATPAGSPGYGAAGDGPLLAPNAGLAAIPVAPFRTDRPRWVLPDDGVTVRIRRDEAPVAVEVDGDVRRTVGQDATVRVERDGEFDVALVEESAAPFR